jgi:hypothetical protein
MEKNVDTKMFAKENLGRKNYFCMNKWALLAWPDRAVLKER